jgi:hypothetical protein
MKMLRIPGKGQTGLLNPGCKQPVYETATPGTQGQIKPILYVFEKITN